MNDARLGAVDQNLSLRDRTLVVSILLQEGDRKLQRNSVKKYPDQRDEHLFLYVCTALLKISNRARERYI